MTMVNNVPTTTIHQGAIDGIDKAKSHAATRALPSNKYTFGGNFLILRTKYSAIKAVSEAANTLRSTPTPKK